MTMDSWPQDPAEHVRFDRMLEPLVEAVRFAYALERRNDGQDIPYAGLPVADRDTVCRPPCMLDADALDYELERGRDALTAIISHALLVGMEQGRRLRRADEATELRGRLFAAFELAGEQLAGDVDALAVQRLRLAVEDQLRDGGPDVGAFLATRPPATLSDACRKRLQDLLDGDAG